MKIFDDLAIYKKVREIVLSGDFEKIAEIAEEFKDSEEIYNAVKGITDLIMVSYPRNKVDFEWMDFREFFEKVECGKFIVSGSEKSAVEAVENISAKKIPATKNLLVNIKGYEDELGMLDVNDATEKIGEKFPEADIVWGVIADDQLANKFFVVMIMEVI